MTQSFQVQERVGAEFTQEGNWAPGRQGQYGDRYVSQFLPPSARLALLGKLFVIDMSAGTAIAPVVAAPVASPQWGLYNHSEQDIMIVLKATVTLQSGTAGLGLAVMGAAAIGKQTAVTADYAGTIKSQTNGQGASPQVWLDSNPTLIGGTPAWMTFVATAVNSLAVNAVGEGLVAPVDGALVAPPGGHMVAFEVVGETGASALFDMQFLIAMLRMS